MTIARIAAGTAIALSTFSTAAMSADAIVFADPEPMEYVRICDVYGAGFFYIPGTETCLQIGGYYRFEVRHNVDTSTGYTTFNRFALGIDVRSETELGTLRGYTDTYFDYGFIGPGYGTFTQVEAAFIELIGQGGTLRMGVSDTPYSRFLGFGGLNIIDSGLYGYNNSTEISYTFTGGNGFSAILALVDNQTASTWLPNIEGGILFEQDWGSIGAIAGYEDATNTWGATAALTANFGVATTKLQAFYGDGPGVYGVFDPAGVQTNWSVLGTASAEFNDRFGAAIVAQWFNTGAWLFQGELQFTPVENLQIIPAVAYATPNGGTWAGLLRVQRSF